MRSFLILLLVTFGVGGMLLSNSRRNPTTAAANAPTTTTSSLVADHNWAKKSLDRAGDVKRQVADQRAHDETR